MRKHFLITIHDVEMDSDEMHEAYLYTWAEAVQHAERLVNNCAEETGTKFELRKIEIAVH